MAINNFHALEINDTLKQLKTSKKGLSEREARSRLKKYGYNELKSQKKDGVITIFFRQFKSVIVGVLIFAAIISGLVGDPTDTIAISMIVLLNAVMGFVQEYKAEKSLETIKRMAAPKAVVLRDRVEKEIEAKYLVPGDIILVEEGKKIPADARLIDVINLKTDESSLTGESTPIEKITAVLAKDTGLVERKNMIYAGTTATYGRAIAVVTTTGVSTQFGKIAIMVQTFKEEETPLQNKINRLGKQLVYAILAICSILLVVWMLRDTHWLEILLTTISLAVSAIPEGLPAVITITLAMGVQKMAKKNAIIRKLSAVETLGSTNVICTDKTGTLTQNQMTVKKIWADGTTFEISGEGYNPKGEILHKGEKAEIRDGLELTLTAGVLCNNAKIHKQDGEWCIVGDPTEGALITSGEKGDVTRKKLEKEYKFLSELPFDSKRKLMTVIYKNSNKKYAFVKGAVDSIIERAKWIRINGKISELTKEAKIRIMKTNERFGDEALRVIAMAYRELNNGALKIKDVEKDLIFVGLEGMIDPPREGVKDAIKTCRDAGINVVMITGDHRNTALAIAKKIGLLTRGSISVTGEELEKMTDEELTLSIENIKVYARVSPQHKVRILEAFKKKGYIVAMTGDGINDAPALKKADIGVAMGMIGTDVSKEASDMVLADDNFTTIVNAIKIGRNIYQNIVNFLKLMLSSNLDEIAVIAIASLAGLPIPLLPVQILWLNLVSDGLPALALGVDPPEEDIMKRKPINQKESILRKIFLFILVGGVIEAVMDLAMFLTQLNAGVTIEKARTMVLTTSIMLELLITFNCRSETKSIFSKITFTNKKLLLAVAGALLSQALILYIPSFQQIFKTVPLTLEDWLLILLFSIPTMFMLPKFFFKEKKKVKHKI